MPRNTVAVTFLVLLLFGALPDVSAGGEPGTALLAQAQDHWRAFRLDQALAIFDEAVAEAGTAEAYREAASFLLAMHFTDRAEALLDEALAAYPGDPTLIEQRAALAAVLGQDELAAELIVASREAGAAHTAWLDNPLFAGKEGSPPYCRLLDPVVVAAHLANLDANAQVRHLQVLAGVMTPEAAPEVVRLLLAAGDTRVIRMGLRALGSLGAEAAAPLEELVAAGDNRLCRAVVNQVRQLRLAELEPVLERVLARESDPGTFDLAQVTVAELEAALLAPDQAAALLEAVPATNSYHYLVLGALARVAASQGHHERAAELQEQAAVGRPLVKSAGDLRGYWECKERSDLRQITELTYYHQYVEPIDASVYGLPVNEFDDANPLSIAERLFLRSYFREQGQELRTSGPLQYPREARHLLRTIERESGSEVDCSGFLVPVDPEAMGEDGGEVKLYEDTGGDNEVNIVVNPYDQRYLVATSNDYGGGAGNDMYRSSDWGNTWTVGDVGASGSCDPVSYYTRTNTPGGMKDVVYHSYLYGPNVKYSTDNGVTWGSCGAVSSNNDRQDIAIDTSPSSACYNTLYVAYDYMGGSNNSRVSHSTGTTFPYCQTWAQSDLGVTGTIGQAVVVSTNGRVHNIFTQYDTPGGVYLATSSNCGSTWSASTKVLSINNAGDFEWGIPSTCSRQVYYYTQADSDRQPSSAYLNNIYVTWNDLSSACTPPGCAGNTTCNNEIFFGRGVPNDRQNPTSWTWTSYNLTDPLSDDYTDEFYPSLTVDQADGTVYVSYYRSNSGAGGNLTARQKQVHYVTVRSTDGGQTWEGPYQVTDSPTNEYDSGADQSMQWGDYTWNDVIAGVCYPSWTDRRENADEDIWASKVCSEPSHWSERAPSFQTAPTTATPIGSKTIQASWTAPDLYWGDGGENTAARKFQLYVDGSLYQDNIPVATTSATYLASDCSTPHSFVARAVNQCGVVKSYASATTTATGCCEQNPTVNVTPDGPQTLCQGTAVLLSAAITGGVGPFEYQWYRDGASIPGAVGTTYLANDSGSHLYNCQVRSTSCSDWSLDPAPVQLTWQAAPTFAGLASVSNPASPTCTLVLTWSAASSACPGPFRYSVYRSTTSGFTPGLANRVASGLAGTTHSDSADLVSDTTYYYVVRTTDMGTGVEETNLVKRSGTPTGPVTIGTWSDDAGDTGSAQLTPTSPWTIATIGGHTAPKVYQTGSYGNDLCVDLVTPVIHLGTGSSLSFWSKYGIESGWDKGEVQVSTDGGSSWTRVAVNYPGSSSYTSDECGLPTGTYFTGTSSTWTLYSGSLATWANQDVKLRWLLSTDTSQNGSGWLVDDIAVTNVEVPGDCTTMSGTPIFSDGFESGNTGAWSTAVP